MIPDRAFYRSAWYFLAATRGGAMRARLMKRLIERPYNPNQLSVLLQVDYKTVRHHLEVLVKNNWLTRSSDKYGELFFCAFSEEQKKVFDGVLEKIGKNL